MRNPLNWAPLYLFLGAFVLTQFQRKGAWWILFFVATVALTDMTGNYVFKHNFQRIRPCGDPDFFYHVRLLVNIVRQVIVLFPIMRPIILEWPLFSSLHARPLLKKWAWIAFYMGRLDCLCTGICWHSLSVSMLLAEHYLACFLASLTGTLFNKRYGFAIFDNQSTVSS